ncbi:hypothetical protein [Cupriavidus sp. UGS-1]|uniref:hypothetical protein n=1 Tax=Cupriavidus sp. UGS-1 TaxID=2899826 RepID=UPI001E61D3F9|nr:hypothetical protein [Cupriavidus sp. UGS-1]MCD9124030.1 hypothetical protein [Cupriavidus sp. UGS-1]
MSRTLALFLAVVLVVLGIAGTGAWLTDRYKDANKRAADAERTVASLRSQLDSAEGSVITVTKYVDRVRTVEVKGATIIKEIPRYVPAQADAACTVPVGFVRLHDAAAAGAVLGHDPGSVDAAPSGVALSAVAETVAGNYTDSHANAEQMTSLQEALRKQGVRIIAEPAP